MSLFSGLSCCRGKTTHLAIHRKQRAHEGSACSRRPRRINPPHPVAGYFEPAADSILLPTRIVCLAPWRRNARPRAPRSARNGRESGAGTSRTRHSNAARRASSAKHGGTSSGVRGESGRHARSPGEGRPLVGEAARRHPPAGRRKASATIRRTRLARPAPRETPGSRREPAEAAPRARWRLPSRTCGVRWPSGAAPGGTAPTPRRKPRGPRNVDLVGPGARPSLARRRRAGRAPASLVEAAAGRLAEPSAGEAPVAPPVSGESGPPRKWAGPADVTRRRRCASRRVTFSPHALATDNPPATLVGSKDRPQDRGFPLGFTGWGSRGRPRPLAGCRGRAPATKWLDEPVA